jgi:hypothetical protein
MRPQLPQQKHPNGGKGPNRGPQGKSEIVAPTKPKINPLHTGRYIPAIGNATQYAKHGKIADIAGPASRTTISAEEPNFSNLSLEDFPNCKHVEASVPGMNCHTPEPPMLIVAP